jgi:NAD(P)H-dependent flavin oxidoreductase YrpB (nitropropane dioxygenase family)
MVAKNENWLPKLRIGDFVADIPIIQGGMGIGISLSRLASSVANEGAVGVIGAAGIGMLGLSEIGDFEKANEIVLQREIRKAKELSDGIIGVNIMMALTDYARLILTAIKEKVKVIFLGAGLPLKLPIENMKKLYTKFGVIVSSKRATNIIIKQWLKQYKVFPAVIVVEGPLAGGHLGFKKNELLNKDITLEKIFLEVLELVKEYEEKYKVNIPVVPAGGIYYGKDIAKYILLGASGVQMATRFVATYECDADMEFKKAFLQANKDDIVLIESPVGLPGRAIKNKFLQDVEEGKKKPFRCPWKCLRTCDYRKAPYCIALALTNAQRGNLKQGFAFAGANAYRVDKIVPVKELIKEITTEANNYLKEQELKKVAM